MISNSVLWKCMKNVRKSINMKLVTTEKRGNYLLSEKNQKEFYNEKIFKKLVSNRNETKTKMLINKTVYLGLAKFDISKIVMHECLYDYM